MLKNFMNLVGVEIETTPRQKPEPTGVVYGEQIQKPALEFSPSISIVDEKKFKDHFSKVFQDNNLPGPDYFELVQAQQNLESVIPDPTMRLRAAFKSLESAGLTKEKVTSGISHYISVIEKDKKDFLAGGEQKNQTEIAERQNKILAEKTNIEQIRLLIAEKQKELLECESRITNLELEKQQAEAKISTYKQGYLITFDQTMLKFKDDLTKIQTLI